MEETVDQQTKDSNMIFNQITNGDFKNYDQALQTLIVLYTPDMTISRSGISHAIKRLEKFYKDTK